MIIFSVRSPSSSSSAICALRSINFSSSATVVKLPIDTLSCANEERLASEEPDTTHTCSDIASEMPHSFAANDEGRLRDNQKLEDYIMAPPQEVNVGQEGSPSHDADDCSENLEPLHTCTMGACHSANVTRVRDNVEESRSAVQDFTPDMLDAGELERLVPEVIDKDEDRSQLHDEWAAPRQISHFTEEREQAEGTIARLLASQADLQAHLAIATDPSCVNHRQDALTPDRLLLQVKNRGKCKECREAVDDASRKFQDSRQEMQALRQAYDDNLRKRLTKSELGELNVEAEHEDAHGCGIGGEETYRASALPAAESTHVEAEPTTPRTPRIITNLACRLSIPSDRDETAAEEATAAASSAGTTSPAHLTRANNLLSCLQHLPAVERVHTNTDDDWATVSVSTASCSDAFDELSLFSYSLETTPRILEQSTLVQTCNRVYDPFGVTEVSTSYDPIMARTQCLAVSKRHSDQEFKGSRPHSPSPDMRLPVSFRRIQGVPWIMSPRKTISTKEPCSPEAETQDRVL